MQAQPDHGLSSGCCPDRCQTLKLVIGSNRPSGHSIAHKLTPWADNATSNISAGCCCAVEKVKQGKSKAAPAHRFQLVCKSWYVQRTTLAVYGFGHHGLVLVLSMTQRNHFQSSPSRLWQWRPWRGLWRGLRWRLAGRVCHLLVCLTVAHDVLPPATSTRHCVLEEFCARQSE